MRKTLFQEEDANANEINVSPLIDVVFILLIFFIVTTTFVQETGVDINKPQAISAQELDSQSILIAITASGQVIYGGRNLGTTGVRPLIERLLVREDVPVVIQADRSVNADLLVRVIDEAKLGGANSVNIATANYQ